MPLRAQHGLQSTILREQVFHNDKVPVDVNAFEAEAARLIEQIENECGHLCQDGVQRTERQAARPV